MTVQLGSNGTEVSKVQQQLSALGFPISVNGVFGATTDEAVRGFQLVTRLLVDGVVGTKTHSALDNGHWEAIADEAITSLPQHRRRLDESVESVGVVTEFLADVRWYRVVVTNFYTTASLNTKLDVMAAAWITNMKARAQPVSFGDAPNSVTGALEATLIGATLVSAAGQLSEFVSGAAHPNPRIVLANMDLASNKTLTGAELFRTGSNWPTVLRNIVLLNGFDPAAVAPASSSNYAQVAITPNGLNLYLYPDQLGLPVAAGVQTLLCPWVKVESVTRPSIIARSLGAGSGGPGPHIP